MHFFVNLCLSHSDAVIPPRQSTPRAANGSGVVSWPDSAGAGACRFDEPIGISIVSLTRHNRDLGFPVNHAPNVISTISCHLA